MNPLLRLTVSQGAPPREELLPALPAGPGASVDNSLFAVVVEQSVDGLLVIDEEGVVRFANPAACALLRQGGGLVGSRLGSPAIEGPIEIQVPTPDGMRHVEMRTSDIYWNGVAASLASLRDVTERTQTEQALRESELKYRSLAETMVQGVVHQDREGRVVWANPAAERIFGLSLEEMRRETPGDASWRATREDGWALSVDEYPAMVALRTGREVRDVTLVLQPSEGVERCVRMHSVPQFQPGEDESSFVYTTLDDLTDLRRAEQRRQAAEQQLLEAQKMESVGRLAGGVAHDFNNMLCVILGNVRLAMDALGSTNPGAEELQEIEKAATRSADLTRQLLAFARRQPSAPRVIDVNEVVAGGLKMLERLIGEDIHLVWRPGDELWPVWIDPAQIDQVLANLAVNARDAIDGVGEILIESDNTMVEEGFSCTGFEVASGEYVRLSVRDDGCGMDAATQKQIFEPFFTTKSQGQGTGLGLAAVHGIVEQNAGFVETSSRPGAGTSFRVYLPRNRADGPETLGSSTVWPDTEGNEDLTSSHESILLVEDDPSVLALTERLLKRLGYIVLAAATPGKALELASIHADELGLVITDVVMPEMDGRALFKRLADLRPGLKCLFMSGYSADIIAHRQVFPEDVSFLEKPFTRGALAVKVREALGR